MDFMATNNLIFFQTMRYLPVYSAITKLIENREIPTKSVRKNNQERKCRDQQQAD